MKAYKTTISKPLRLDRKLRCRMTHWFVIYSALRFHMGRYSFLFFSFFISRLLSVSRARCDPHSLASRIIKAEQEAACW